jgi:predicted nucleotidyltransferase
MQLDQLRAFKPQIMEIAAQYGVSDIRVFGSVARGDADETSDVDLMIHMAKGKSLFDLIEFKQGVEEVIRKKVDVVEIEAVKNPIRRRHMLEHVVPL